MDFKKELVKELGLGAIAEETMLNDYVKACEVIAVRYHDHKVKTLGLFSVSGSCFWKHKWGKWKQFKQIMTHVKHGGTFVEMWQQRECKNCGKVQQEYISG